jgi:hypothetical protein
VSETLIRYQRDLIDALFRKDPEPHLSALGGRIDRWRVYRRMARRRLSDVLGNSFPRLSALLGDRWEGIVERFFDEAPPRSPYIRDVSGELATFFERIWPTTTESASFPPWMIELARHEWALLDVSYIGEEEGALRADVGELRMDRPAVLAPAHRILRAGWSVHRLGLDGDASVVVEGTFALCLYRDSLTHQVRALELSPVAAGLLEGVDAGGPLVEVVKRVAAQNDAVIDEGFVAAFSDLIADLVERGLWLGSLAEVPASEV